MDTFKVGDIVTNKNGQVLRITKVIKDDSDKIVDYDLIDATAPNRKARRSQSPKTMNLNKIHR